MKLSRTYLAILVILAPAIVFGQNPVGQTGGYFLRGRVMAIQPDQITVAPHSGGAPLTVPLVKGWTVTLISPADDSIVAIGNIVNIVEVDEADGISRALFVDYLATRNARPGATTTAPAVTGGRAWSQLPGRDEFGAWGTIGRITRVEKTPKGLLVVTEIPDGAHTSLVPPGTVMVRNDPQDQSRVRVGENVAVILNKGADGKPVARRVLVGANGTIPPM